jgi:hypothetical protein
MPGGAGLMTDVRDGWGLVRARRVWSRFAGTGLLDLGGSSCEFVRWVLLCSGERGGGGES